jgi:hypothetical protein
MRLCLVDNEGVVHEVAENVENLNLNKIFVKTDLVFEIQRQIHRILISMNDEEE